MNKCISVVIPMYNCKNTIERCVNSIICQTYENIEIILVDDGSTDDTYIKCNEMKKKDERIKIIRKENGGVSSARNIGIKQARGIFITFIDADDYIRKDYISTLYNNMGDNDLVISNAIIIKNNSSKKFNRLFMARCVNYKRAVEMLLSDKFFQSTPWGKMYKTELAKRVKFDEKMSIAEDHKFLIDYISISKKIKLIPFYGYIYVINENSLSRANEKYIDEIFYCSDLIKKYENTKYEKFAINHYLNIVKSYVAGKSFSDEEKKIIKNDLIKYRRNYSIVKMNSIKEKIKYYLLIRNM